eukprot:CAMPEP_0205849848 /NCGR_PEP_ID=MMETSP1019-20131125/35709_1 /ASSEMBLY_ACC=CAM_ASM_000403 /TAXON_ID=46462 /ORGANISM="Anophryoides haemophila, Strain AH6" /LENGTH=52 /DNA_ID=CAMNT_0053189315 /DNA_START=14 /DNA_END=168 /DNA_ORIENTATION=+
MTQDIWMQEFRGKGAAPSGDWSCRQDVPRCIQTTVGNADAAMTTCCEFTLGG